MRERVQLFQLGCGFANPDAADRSALRARSPPPLKCGDAFRLRTLLIVLALGPAALAIVWGYWNAAQLEAERRETEYRKRLSDVLSNPPVPWHPATPNPEESWTGTPMVWHDADGTTRST